VVQMTPIIFSRGSMKIILIIHARCTWTVVLNTLVYFSINAVLVHYFSPLFSTNGGIHIYSTQPLYQLSFLSF